jgi:thiol-disulfide isomerase/thioredoxin
LITVDYAAIALAVPIGVSQRGRGGADQSFSAAAFETESEAELQSYKVWLDRVVSAFTALVVVLVGYFVVTERVVPALRGAPVRVHEGERLPEVLEFERLEDSKGSRGGATIRLPDGRATLMLVFNSTCQACYRTLSAWQQLVSAAGDEADVLAVALDDDQRAAGLYAQRNLPTALAVAPKDPGRFVGTLGVGVVPFTALLDPDAVLVFVRQGSLDALAVGSLIRALGALAGS